MLLINPCLTKKLGLALALASVSGWACAAMIYIETDTHLKASTAQASALPAASKCAVTKGRGIDISSISEGGADHFKVVLPRAYPGCALTTAYVYKPHVSTDSTAISTYALTVFKKTTASAGTLPASSKCDMPIGIYGSSSTVAAEAGHFKVNLKTLMPGCSFSQGYAFDGHAASGIKVLSLTDSVWLKKSTADSSTLPAADKCLIAKANYVLTKSPVANGTHWQVNLAKTPSGCSFNSGYVYYELSYLANPSGGGGGDLGYTVPLKNGYKGSAWCVCRSVGTSPHIGQDWNADGTETSVAIANGVVANKGFDSACGHSVTLRDDSGAEWIYRHLNSNSLTQNQRVSKGQTLGNHSSYPTSGCGTGPHLHIERRSAGGFGDSAVFKSCEAGPEPCYFDPNAFASRSALASNSDALKVHSEAAELPNTAPSACRANPAGYPEVQASELSQYAESNKGLTADIRLHELDAQKQIELAVALKGNAENRCEGQNCLTAMSLVAEQLDGTLRRVFHHSSLKNQPAALLA